VSLPGALSPTGGKLWERGKIFPASISRGPNSNALAYAERALSTYGRSTWALITLFVVDGISQVLFNAEKIVLVNAIRLCRYLHRFQRYLCSNLKVVVNRTDFWTFFVFPNFKRGGAPKCCTCVNTTT